MNQQSIKRRIRGLEEVSIKSQGYYFPDADGFIDDEYRPGKDILFITIYEGKDGKPSADQPNLKWRGQTYELDDEKREDTMLAHYNDTLKAAAK